LQPEGRIMKYFSASFYYVNYKVLGNIIRQTYKHFRLRIWLVSVVFVFLYSLNQFIHLIFRLIDEIFYPGFHKKEIKQPVFIISNPRSGTTYLHRLIALDNDRFAFTKFSHTFQMTTSFARFYNVIRWIDRNILHGIITRTMDKMDERFWGGWDDIHALGFNKTEEDEMVFAQMMMSVGVYIPFPYFHLTNDTKFLDRENDEVKKNVMDFYESSVKRFMHANDPAKTYLAKNVMSTGRFKTLMQRFPDAKIIYIARHPYDAVPSFASMFSSMYALYSPPIADNDPAKKTWAQLGIDYFKYSQEMKRTLPASQFIMVKYDDLLANPQGTVKKIYEHFSWAPSQKFLNKLSKEEVRNRQYKSHHEYSLEQYGYTRQEIYAELGPIMDEMGFDKEF